MHEHLDALAKSSGELRYPFRALREPGQMIEVAPGVRWQRMPLPMSLNHISLWAIGWTPGRACD
jgi:hypothetical protein